MKLAKVCSAAIAALSLSTLAYATPIGGLGDLIIGFNAQAPLTNNTTSFEVNLGTATSVLASADLVNGTGQWTTLAQFSGSSLLSLYGSLGTAGGSELSFALFGTYGGTDATRRSLISSVATGGAFTATAQTNASTNTATTRANTLFNLYNPVTTPTTSGGAFLVDDADSNSYGAREAQVVSIFTAATATNTGGAALADGAAYLDLYQVNNGGGTTSGALVGAFRLTSAGDLQLYTSGAAVPEPSTYAALMGAAVLGFVALRRRRQMVAA